MWYVYLRSSSGREDCCGIYNTRKEAIDRIYSLYSGDKHYSQLGEYYYFMKEH